LTLALLTSAAPAIADEGVTTERHSFYLPADIASGVAFGRDDPKPYSFRARLTPSWSPDGGGAFRIGPEIAALFQNPLWFGGLGLSGTAHVWGLPTKEVGLLAILDHMYWEGDHPSTGFALIVDANGAFRIGGRVDRDWIEHSTSAYLTIGADIPAVIKLLGPQQDGQPKVKPSKADSQHG